jgi:hypothetical protein
MAEKPTVRQAIEVSGTFRDHIAQVRKAIEPELRAQGIPESEIPETAENQAQYVVANDWLIAKWGTHHGCAECGNVEWTVSSILPAAPSGFLSFLVTCRFCGNTLQLIPGHADLDEPHLAEQMQFPAPE